MSDPSPNTAPPDQFIPMSDDPLPEFVGRLPDYVKELEAERDAAHARINQLEAALRAIHPSCAKFNTGCPICPEVFRRRALENNDG